MKIMTILSAGLMMAGLSGCAHQSPQAEDQQEFETSYTYYCQPGSGIKRKKQGSGGVVAPARAAPRVGTCV